MDPSRPNGRQLLSRPAAVIGGLAVIAVVGLSLVLFATLGQGDEPTAQDLVVAGPQALDHSPVTGPERDVVPSQADQDGQAEEPSGPSSPGDQGADGQDLPTPPPTRRNGTPGRPVGADPAPGAPVVITTTTTTTTTVPAPDPAETAPPTISPGTTTTSIPGSGWFVPDESPPPEPVPGAGRATIDTAQPADGGPTLSNEVRLQVSVAEEPVDGGRLFLVCNLTDPADEARTTWYGKAELTGTGARTVDVTFTRPDPANRDPVGTRWICGVASAEPSVADLLLFLMRMDEQGVLIDPATGLPFDVLRQTLPPGSSIISNTIALTIARAAP